jgi:hypothetical protein
MSERLFCEITSASALQEGIMKEMFSLFSRYYDGVNWRIFHKDLMSKDWVILFREFKSKKVQGFTSLVFYEHHYLDDIIAIVYSGDTVVHQPYWNSRIVAKSWIRAVMDLALGTQHPLYWLLISSGFRTYRYLPVFFSHYYPCYNRHTPPHIQVLMNDIAKHLFADQYDRTTGIVRFREGCTPLINRYSSFPEIRDQDPHSRFFEQQNPGHSDGDELVCLTEISLDNLTSAGKRMTR